MAYTPIPAGVGGGTSNSKPTTTISPLTVAVGTLNFANLHGDSDGGYYVKGRILNDSGSARSYTLTLNGLVTGITYIRFGASPTVINDTPAQWCNVNNGGTLDFEIWLPQAERAASNTMPRQGFIRLSAATSTPGLSFLLMYSFLFSDKTNEITQIGVITDTTTTGIGVGSRASLYTVAS